MLEGCLPVAAPEKSMILNNPTTSLRPMVASKPSTELYQLPPLGMFNLPV